MIKPLYNYMKIIMIVNCRLSIILIFRGWSSKIRVTSRCVINTEMGLLG
ncbi:hypothetical protein HMPREF9103_03170 [Lentilactobacillus parafarraginis F0439]|uniref:Uncharacterized protein n=1 Tax=Lentilactobacillus parafarraginis F0439 TaxID=797515 RepID=G9ZTT5_9LACO|nr:hypothetical protein HMPREF9103_03170 [Lentilactobacillus parafarraginis F0439]